MSTCRSCGADIIWALTERGHRIPIDAEPVEAGGNIVFVDSLPTDGKQLRVRVITAAGETGTHVSHFASCPNAGDHRKRKAASA